MPRRSGHPGWHPAWGALVLLILSTPPALAENAWVASTAIRVIDLDRGDVIGHLTVAEDQVVTEIAFDPAGDAGYVASMGGLFRIDTATLSVAQHLSDRPTCSVAVARDADRLVALHLRYPGDGLADRQRGIPSTVTLAVYERSTGAVLGATELHGAPLRVRIAPDGQRVYVLDSGDALLTVLDGAPRVLGEIDLAPDVASGQPTMCTDLALSPDGLRVAVVRNGGEGAALVVVHPAADGSADSLGIEGLGQDVRARGASFSPDGAAIHLTSIGQLGRWTADRAGASWRDVGHEFSLVATAPSGRYLVLATPTFDPSRGSGGVLIADGEGRPLRVVELPDISPYTLAIQP